MRLSTTGVLALAGSLAATLGWAQEAPPPDAQKKPPAEAQAAAPAEPDEKPIGFREDVVVTAQKRTEEVADIPASVTVLGGELLEQQRADDLVALTPLVPGLSLTSTRPGVTRVTLRGINT